MNGQERAEITRHLRLLRQGDHTAVRPVFKLLWPTLTSFARRHGLSDTDSEEAAQRAIIKAIQRVADYDPTRDGLSWIFAMTVCEVRTMRRQRSRRRETSMEPLRDVLAERCDDDDPVVAREAWQSFEGAMSALSVLDREALRVAFGRTPPTQPADATSRKRKQRALEKLISLMQASPL